MPQPTNFDTDELNELMSKCSLFCYMLIINWRVRYAHTWRVRYAHTWHHAQPINLGTQTLNCHLGIDVDHLTSPVHRTGAPTLIGPRFVICHKRLAVLILHHIAHRAKSHVTTD